MQPLLDGDILVYECAFGGEILGEDGSKTILPFENVAALIDNRVTSICLAVGATEEPILCLTGDTNFRDKIAKTKPYKGNRSKPKPFHYANARAYIQSFPKCIVTDGIEADDWMSIEQTSRLHLKDTIICTRDKDLRMVEGWHYGHEHGAQPEFFPQWVNELGGIEYDAKKNKISGTGYLFFCSQLITGDTVDNIPGLPKKGPKAAWVALEGAESVEDALARVVSLYQEVMDDKWEEYLLEQGQLLWMIREVDEEGKPVMWRF